MSFNGAATLSLRKGTYKHGNTLGTASFNGAATLSLRKLTSRGLLILSDYSFNGAATLSLRKNLWCRGLDELLCCFNGAATLSLRKLVAISRRRARVVVLQWGRNFIVAETRRNNAHHWRKCAASMGPQLYRCGNGAADQKDAGKLLASMGPQLYRCGNLRDTGPRCH